MLVWKVREQSDAKEGLGEGAGRRLVSSFSVRMSAKGRGDAVANFSLPSRRHQHFIFYSSLFSFRALLE